MFATRPKQEQRQKSPEAAASTSTRQPTVAPLKANEQTWSRHFSGSSNGIEFQLRIQRGPGGHLHARYQVTPGRRNEGWHLEGQVREDDSFVLKGTENEALFEGTFGEGGQLLTVSFRNRDFAIESFKLARTNPTIKLNARTPGRDVSGKQEPGGTAPQAAGDAESGQVNGQAGEQAQSGWRAVRTGHEGFDNQPEVQQAIIWGAQQLQVNPNDLAAVIGYESAGTFSAGVENEAARRAGRQGAVGLIQFTPSVGIPALNNYLVSRAGRARARELGVTVTSVSREDLLGMTPAEQMKFVVLYFSIPVNRLTPGDRYDGIYQEILAPGREADVWYRAADGGRNYRDNRQFDTNRDGEITRLEAAGEIREQGYVVNYFEPSEGSTAGAGGQQNQTAPVQGAGPQAEPGRVRGPGRQQEQTPQTTPAQAEPEGQEPSFDDRVTQALENYTARFIYPVTVNWREGLANRSQQLTVRTPYFIYAGAILRTVQQNRARMSAADRRAYDRAPRLATYGKASPEQMQSFTQILVDMNPFGVAPRNITTAMITNWLKRYGIGVDCSGFVTQSLDYATTELTGRDPGLGEERDMRNAASLNSRRNDFERVNSIADVRPGDTMWLEGHIRIVTQVGPGPGGRGIQMMIAESTPNAQLPAARAQGGVERIGVDRAIWWFPEGDRASTRGVQKKVSGYNWNEGQGDRWETPNTIREEAFHFSRYRPLDAGRGE